jgi:hypothetical protein
MPKDAVLLNNLCANPEPIHTVCKFRFEACVSGEKASAEQGIVVEAVFMQSLSMGFLATTVYFTLSA